MFVVKPVNQSMSPGSFEILRSAMERRLLERGCALSPEAGYTITLNVDDRLRDDRYIIEATKEGAALRAANDCALHAAAGRFLMAGEFDGKGGFIPPAGTIDVTPECRLRGMYFATHFGNYYHNAPIEHVYRVIEDLALRGCNSLLVWYDMHHYSGIDDPGSLAMIERLRSMLSYAGRIGMQGSLTMLSNEAFATSPERLRADYHVQGRYKKLPEGHYHVEICPSKPGGIEEILRTRRQMLDRFKDVNPRYVVYWPYDQGGCTCPDCEPWGSNGFLRLLPRFNALVKEVLPHTETIISTWYFDRFIDGEWDGFYTRLARGEFAEYPYIMSFFFNGELPRCIAENGIPKGVKFIDFPEISMYSCSPWGGFGANPLTRFIQRTNDGVRGLYSGGFPYSEGIFEDINKWICLANYSGIYKNAADAVREYVKFEFCCKDEELVDAVIRTETGLARASDENRRPRRYEIWDTSDIRYVYDVITGYDEKLPEGIRRSDRWRMIYLRAVIDYELARNDFVPWSSERVQRAMTELRGIYFSSDNSNCNVRPPVGI